LFYQVSNHVKKSITDLGEACKELMVTSGQVQSDPRNIQAKKALNEAGRKVKEKVNFLFWVIAFVRNSTPNALNLRFW